jgi:hypothetical protein
MSSSSGGFLNVFGEDRITPSLFYPTAGDEVANVMRRWFFGPAVHFCVGTSIGASAGTGVLAMDYLLLGEVSAEMSILPLLGIVFLLDPLHTTLEEHLGQKKGG